MGLGEKIATPLLAGLEEHFGESWIDEMIWHPVHPSYHYIRNQRFVRSMVLVFGATGYQL